MGRKDQKVTGLKNLTKVLLRFSSTTNVCIWDDEVTCAKGSQHDLALKGVLVKFTIAGRTCAL